MKIKTGTLYGFSDIGQREQQQDAMFPSVDNLNVSTSMYTLCDGMGGHVSGEQASRIVVTSLQKYFEAFMLPEPSRQGFLNLLERTRQELDQKYDEKQGQHQMGTTLTFLCFTDQGYLAAHIGDSRIYHLRPGAITQIIYRSKDHSLVSTLQQMGKLTPLEALTYDQKNILDRAVMPKSRHDPEVMEGNDVQAGDYFMLCSDGVTEHLTDEMIRFIFAPYRTPDEICQLIHRHCSLSSDNNTCLIIPIEQVEMDNTIPTEIHSVEETVTEVGETSESPVDALPDNFQPPINEEVPAIPEQDSLPTSEEESKGMTANQERDILRKSVKSVPIQDDLLEASIKKNRENNLQIVEQSSETTALDTESERPTFLDQDEGSDYSIRTVTQEMKEAASRPSGILTRIFGIKKQK